MIKDISEIKQCPECGSENIIHNKKKQQIVCKDCGMIYEPMIPEKEKKFEKASGLDRTTSN